ncbi:MAG TPA: hypothetical protein VMB80_07945 [Candidatus Acidoferrum sp.]|nr:hypothetical protein [Candidatus Acidoferrum sp.]
MNLAKLLAAGKSIVNGCEQISYRANKHVYLPKFGPVANPFQSAAPEPGKPAADVEATPVRKIAAPVPAKTQKLPPWPPGPTRATSWASKLNPVSLWRDTPVAPEARPPVQCELSLDTVKVVHNDLSDADVEVVPMKSRPASPAAAPAGPPPGRPWEALAERMFRATID